MKFLPLCVLLFACRQNPTAPVVPDAEPTQRRWLKPPSADVRAYPPHAILPDGVGPYLLGAPLSDILHDLPAGPRVKLLQVGRLVNWRVVRAEKGNLLIGAGKSNRVGYIAILSGDVARTETGAGVGATGAELLAALGQPSRARNVAHDRLVYEFDALPQVRFVTDGEQDADPSSVHVVAVLVSGKPRPTAMAKPVAQSDTPPAKVPESHCRDGLAFVGVREELLALAHGRRWPPAPPVDGGSTVASAPVVRDSSATIRYGCFTTNEPEAAVIVGKRMIVVGGSAGGLRTRARLVLERADFVSVIDVDQDGRDEVVVGARWRDRLRSSVEIRVYRWEPGRATEALRSRPLRVTAAQAKTSGFRLADVDLLVEMRARDGVLVVGGMYMAKSRGVLRELAPFRTNALRVRSRRRLPSRLGLEPGMETP